MPGRARRAVTFAEDEQRRRPALVAADVEPYEFAEGLDVSLNAPEFLHELGVGRAAESRADRVDQHQVAFVEQRVGIVFDAIRRRRHESIGLQHDFARTERSHVQPDRSRSRPAVEGEGERPLGRFLAIERVGDIKHLRFDLPVAALDGQAARQWPCTSAAFPSTVIW